MNVPFLDLKSQYLAIKQEIDQAIASVLEAGIFIGGHQVAGFEKSFSGLYGIKNCIALGNGTDALFAILKSIGIQANDEVITPAWSWISTSETISLAGGKPVFADVDPAHYTMNVDAIESKITPRTKAVVVVHLYGQAAAIKAIKLLCSKRNLILVEDCAQAHLTEEDHLLVGKSGLASAFSFYPTKNLGAYGDAGCAITDDIELSARIRRFANHGGLFKDEHFQEGTNSRMDPLQAVVLTVKLKYLAAWTDKRIRNATWYDTFLKNVESISIPEVRLGTKHSFHAYVIRAKKRDMLKDFLLSKGIQTVIHYPCALPFEPAYHALRHTAAHFPVASRLAQEVLSLPIYPELTNDQIKYVGDSIKAFYGK